MVAGAGDEGIRPCCASLYRVSRFLVSSSICSPSTAAVELVFSAAAAMLLRQLAIILKLFFKDGGVYGGVLGKGLWRSGSFSALAKWGRILSLLLGFASGSLALLPARVDLCAGLRSSPRGVGIRGSVSSPAPAGVGRWAFGVLNVPWRVCGAESCGFSKAWCLLTVRGEDLLRAATAFIGGGGRSGRTLAGVLVAGGQELRSQELRWGCCAVILSSSRVFFVKFQGCAVLSF